MEPSDTTNKPLPAEVMAFIDTQVPVLKDQPPDPKDFYGREIELDELMNAIQTVTSGQSLKGQAGIEIRAAAPGAGKTSLIDGLKRRLQREGIGHIRLKPTELTDPQRFSNAVKRQPPYSYFAQGQMILEKATNTISVTTDAVLHFTSHIIAKITTAGIADAPNTEITQKVIEQWRSNATPEPAEVVQAVNTMWRNGTVITFDEAQDLADVAGKGKAKQCAKAIIETLASLDPREQAGIDRAMLCCFGLADTPTAVHELGSPTVHTRVLAPLHPGYIRMMIRGAIRKGAAGNEELEAWADGEWTEGLTREFGDWTRHGQAAAQAAQDLLTEYGAELQSAEWADMALRTLVLKYRQSTYDGIREPIGNQKMERWMPELATQALWCNGNEVRRGSLEDAITNGILHHRQDLPEIELERKRERGLRRLMRCGLLDVTDRLPDSEDKRRDAYYSPIPSLLRDLSGTSPTDPRFIRRLLGKAGLNDDPEHRPRNMFQPTWPNWSPEIAAARQKRTKRGSKRTNDD